MVVLNRKDMSSIMAGYGTWGDMTVTLKDGTKFIVPARFTTTERRRKILAKQIKERNFKGFTMLALGDEQ